MSPIANGGTTSPASTPPGLPRSRARQPASTPDAAILERCRNQPIAQELLSAGHGLCPTEFQAAQFPAAFRGTAPGSARWGRLRLLPAGAAGATLAIRCSRGLADDIPVVTYATRGMEPHRGFPQVMAAFAEIQARNPRAVAVIAGDNGVHYGGNAERRVDWKAEALRRLDLDESRTVFTGTLAARRLSLAPAAQ